VKNENDLNIARLCNNDFVEISKLKIHAIS